MPEVLDRGGDRARCTVPEDAERPTEDVVTLVEQQLEVPLLALALLKAGQRLDEPPGSFPARGALAARLVLVELGPPQDGPDHTGGLVEDLQRLGAQHGSGGADTLVVQGDVEVLGGEDRRGRAARCPELELVSLANTAGELEQLAQRGAERGLELSGAAHVPRQREERHALALLGAHRP